MNLKIIIISKVIQRSKEKYSMFFSYEKIGFNFYLCVSICTYAYILYISMHVYKYASVCMCMSVSVNTCYDYKKNHKWGKRFCKRKKEHGNGIYVT